MRWEALKGNISTMSGQLVIVRSPLGLYRYLLRRLAAGLPGDAFSYYKHRIRQVSMEEL